MKCCEHNHIRLWLWVTFQENYFQRDKVDLLLSGVQLFQTQSYYFSKRPCMLKNFTESVPKVMRIFLFCYASGGHSDNRKCRKTSWVKWTLRSNNRQFASSHWAFTTVKFLSSVCEYRHERSNSRGVCVTKANCAVFYLEVWLRNRVIIVWQEIFRSESSTIATRGLVPLCWILPSPFFSNPRTCSRNLTPVPKVKKNLKGNNFSTIANTQEAVT